MKPITQNDTADFIPKQNPLQGVWTAVLTPLHADLSADTDLLIRHCQWLLATGSNGLVLLGSTGEANSFSVPERMAIIKSLSKAALPADRCLIGTGCCALPDTIELSHCASGEGFNQLLILPPFYYKDVSTQGLLSYFDSLLEKIYTQQLRILYYHFPKLTGIAVCTELVRELTGRHPNTFAGLKDSSGDLEQMLVMTRRFPELRIFSGSEEFLLDILKVAGAGCISATTNITCGLAAEIYKQWREPGTVAIQEHLTDIRKAITRFPVIPALKTILAVIHTDNRWLNLRPPHLQLTPQDQKSLIAAMNNLGIV
jgi:4-hydroxy-tetrahydrodipicolinate synthase